MTSIFLAVIAGVAVLLAFKLFPKFNIHTFSAILYNYLTAGITGILFMSGEFSLTEIFKEPWIAICIPLGALFIAVFYLLSVTAQKISVATASVANKMSVSIPVLYSIVFLGEDLSATKITGIVLALVAVYLSAGNDHNKDTLKKSMWLPVLVFVGSGMIDTSINACKAHFSFTDEESALFTTCTFLSAFFFGIITLAVLLAARKIKTEFIQPKNILAGVFLGVPNYFSIYFIFQALESGTLQSAQLFPVLNLSNVILTAFFGWWLFKEHLSGKNLIGIALAVVSIILIAL